MLRKQLLYLIHMRSPALRCLYLLLLYSISWWRDAIHCCGENKQNKTKTPTKQKTPQKTKPDNCNETNAPLSTCRNSSIFVGQLKYNLDASKRTASLSALMHYARSQTSPNAITASWTVPNLPVSLSPLPYSSAFPLKIGLSITFFFLF